MHNVGWSPWMMHDGKGARYIAHKSESEPSRIPEITISFRGAWGETPHLIRTKVYLVLATTCAR